MIFVAMLFFFRHACLWCGATCNSNIFAENNYFEASSKAYKMTASDTDNVVTPPSVEASDYMKYVDLDANGILNSSDSACVLQYVLNSAFKIPVKS